MNNSVKSLSRHTPSFLLSKYLGREMLDHVVCVYLTRQETAQLSSGVAAPLNIPTSRA